MPWRSELSFIDALQAVPTDYEPGRGRRCSPSPATASAPLICFESAFAPLARQYARRGADALVVLTNNRSYRRSANSAQHLAMGQFRAAETGRPLLQAAISGISALVDHRGRVQARTRLFEPTVLVGEVTTYRGRTPYTAVGTGPWSARRCSWPGGGGQPPSADPGQGCPPDRRRGRSASNGGPDRP